MQHFGPTRLYYTCCRGRGQIVAAAVASEQVILGTSKGYLLRYFWDESGNERGGHMSRCRYYPLAPLFILMLQWT